MQVIGTERYVLFGMVMQSDFKYLKQSSRAWVHESVATAYGAPKNSAT